jgi:hypothetical protein
VFSGMTINCLPLQAGRQAAPSVHALFPDLFVCRPSGYRIILRQPKVTGVGNIGRGV